MKLREAMKSHRERTGERMTYKKLAERTGLSKATLASIGTRNSYNASLNTIGKICQALGCAPGEILEIAPETTKKRKRR